MQNDYDELNIQAFIYSFTIKSSNLFESESDLEIELWTQKHLSTSKLDEKV